MEQPLPMDCTTAPCKYCSFSNLPLPSLCNHIAPPPLLFFFFFCLTLQITVHCHTPIYIEYFVFREYLDIYF